MVEALIDAVTRELLATGNVAGNFWGVVQWAEGIDIWFRAFFVTTFCSILAHLPSDIEGSLMSDYRPLKRNERELLTKLLDVNFPSRDELREQFRNSRSQRD